MHFFDEILYTDTKKALDSLKQSPAFLNGFYLSGGTALALQLGHRKSNDLDWFTKDPFTSQNKLNDLRPLNPTVTAQNQNTLDAIISGTKVSFLEYPYPLLREPLSYNEVPISSVLDIACSKLSAIVSRGSKKDFIDLYFILQEYSLKNLISSFQTKFNGVNYQLPLILKSLIYFADADEDPAPDMLIKISWEEIKTNLTDTVSKYISTAT